jgi:hypothetical protein
MGGMRRDTRITHPAITAPACHSGAQWIAHRVTFDPSPRHDVHEVVPANLYHARVLRAAYQPVRWRAGSTLMNTQGRQCLLHAYRFLKHMTSHGKCPKQSSRIFSANRQFWYRKRHRKLQAALTHRLSPCASESTAHDTPTTTPHQNPPLYTRGGGLRHESSTPLPFYHRGIGGKTCASG